MRDRQVYKYHNGNEEVFADPIRCYRALYRETNGEFSSLVKDCSDKSNPLLAVKAAEALIAAARVVFELKDFDKKTGEGVTDEEVDHLLDSFLGWLDKKKLKKG